MSLKMLFTLFWGSDFYLIRIQMRKRSESAISILKNKIKSSSKNSPTKRRTKSKQANKIQNKLKKTQEYYKEQPKKLKTCLSNQKFNKHVPERSELQQAPSKRNILLLSPRLQSSQYSKPDSKRRKRYEQLKKNPSLSNADSLYINTYQLGMGHFMQKEDEEAIYYLQKANALRSLTTHSSKRVSDQQYRQGTKRIILSLLYTQRYDEALEYLDELKNFCIQEYGEQSIEMQWLWRHMAYAFAAKGQYSQALQLFLASEPQNIPGNNGKMVIYHNSLAQMYQILGEEQAIKEHTLKALQCFKALQLSRNRNKPHLQILWCRERLACIYYRQKDYEKCLKEMTVCLQLGQFQKKFGEKFREAKSQAKRWVEKLSNVSDLSPCGKRRVVKLQRLLMIL